MTYKILYELKWFVVKLFINIANVMWESAPKERGTMKKKTQGKKKVEKVMKEFGEKKLHSGAKDGPVVNNRKQAVAIALSEAGLSNKKNKD
jgi:hypothetical protein